MMLWSLQAYAQGMKQPLFNADLPSSNQLLGKKEVDLDISFFMLYLNHIVL